jgi:hypothetical protein
MPTEIGLASLASIEEIITRRILHLNIKSWSQFANHPRIDSYLWASAQAGLAHFRAALLDIPRLEFGAGAGAQQNLLERQRRAKCTSFR